MREHEWNQAAKGKTAAHGPLGVNAAVAVGERVEDAGLPIRAV